MNLIVQSIEKIPGAVTENISISWIQMLLIYLCITAFYLLFQQKKKKFYWIGIGSVFCLVLLFDFSKYQTQNIESQTVYTLSKGVAVSFNHHGRAVIFSDSIHDKNHKDYVFCIQNHERKERIQSVIVPIDSNYRNDFLLKQGDFVFFCGESFHLARRKRRYYETSHKISVDEVLLLEDHVKTEYIGKVIEYPKVPVP